jgi:hypothetical protein
MASMKKYTDGWDDDNDDDAMLACFLVMMKMKR